MTTPGRTHISWQDQTGQLHELISYIGYLEAKLQYLQYHHEHCGTPLAAPFAMDVDLSYLPPEIVVDKESQNELISSFAPGTIDSAPKPTAAVPASQKSPDGNPRWKRIVDQMTKGWDKPSSWADKRRAINLDSVDKNQYALTVILGLKKDLPQSLYQTQLLDQTEPNASPADALIFSARMYALDTKASEKNAGFVVQIHNFRELVFASLCVVMEQQGLPIDTINDLMRICMSSSGPANLYRLRRGALWVNRVIAGMIRKGWHHGATEFFLLSGRPVSQYGLLWEACVHSFPYLSEKLAQIHRQVEIPIDDSGWIPFSIPLIIKGLVGDSLTLSQICTALDYVEETLEMLPLRYPNLGIS